jgi:hypothetical protein
MYSLTHLGIARYQEEQTAFGIPVPDNPLRCAGHPSTRWISPFDLFMRRPTIELPMCHNRAQAFFHLALAVLFGIFG